MPFKDLREFIDTCDRIGEVKHISGAHWDLEIGAITELLAEIPNSPAPLFDDIPGYPKGHRVFANPLASNKRTALILDQHPETPPFEMLKYWIKRTREIKPVPPRWVDDAPVKEHVLTGDQINLFDFPSPKWHENDPGRYLGTGDTVIMRAPGEDWINLATYRMEVHDEKTLGLWISPGKHGYLFLQKYHERGEAAPVAVSVGHDPLLFVCCATFFPYAMSEYDFAGHLRGAPIEVTRGVITDLPIPATAEIVIEGEIPPRNEEMRMEGPFGEFTGYYAVGPHPQLIIRVKSVMFRSKPIILGAPPFKFPSHWFTTVPFNAGETWDALNKVGVPDVQGVWQFGSWFPFITVVSIRQRYAGHAKQAGLVAMGSKGSAYCGRYVIVVDEDVDITSLEDVMWAVATRCEPERDMDLIRECWSSPIDPIISPHMRFEMAHGQQNTSRVIINACKPYAWKDKFPRTNIASKELRTKILDKYSDIFAGAEAEKVKA
ncbi:MAG: UbiD family decarboxylase [Candidatus Tectomicrobia bacterium]|nr:UbiD family decarboxylase [Candidatus Tectomicrobia bacterium]